MSLCPQCKQDHIEIGYAVDFHEWQSIIALDASENKELNIWGQRIEGRKVDKKLEEHMLRCLQEVEHKLDDWSRGFVKSISEMPPEKTLTPKQEAKLREIYERYY